MDSTIRKYTAIDQDRQIISKSAVQIICFAGWKNGQQAMDLFQL
jgi:hypothetical protein